METASHPRETKTDTEKVELTLKTVTWDLDFEIECLSHCDEYGDQTVVIICINFKGEKAPPSLNSFNYTVITLLLRLWALCQSVFHAERPWLTQRPLPWLPPPQRQSSTGISIERPSLFRSFCLCDTLWRRPAEGALSFVTMRREEAAKLKPQHFIVTQSVLAVWDTLMKIVQSLYFHTLRMQS